MKRWCVMFVALVILLLVKLGTHVQGQETNRPIKGYVYGVFEVEDSGNLRSKMVNAGFKEVASSRLARFGLREHAKSNYRYFCTR